MARANDVVVTSEETCLLMTIEQLSLFPTQAHPQWAWRAQGARLIHPLLDLEMDLVEVNVLEMDHEAKTLESSPFLLL